MGLLYPWKSDPQLAATVVFSWWSGRRHRWPIRGSALRRQVVVKGQKHGWNLWNFMENQHIQKINLINTSTNSNSLKYLFGKPSQVILNQVWDCLQNVHASTPHSRSAPCDTLQSSPRLRWRSTRNPPRQMWRPTISKLVLRRKILDLPSPSKHLRPKKSSHQKFLHHIPLLLGMMAVDYDFGFYFSYESLDDPAINLGKLLKCLAGWARIQPRIQRLDMTIFVGWVWWVS